MAKRPSVAQVRLFRWICRQLGINASECLQLQDEMDREEMSEWIRERHGRAKLMSLDLDQLAEGIRKIQKATRADSKQIRRDKAGASTQEDAQEPQEGEEDDTSQ